MRTLRQARRWGADPEGAGRDTAAAERAQERAAPSIPAALAASLKRTRSPPPDYPENALSQQIAGSVAVQFTVDVNGETRDIRVLEANPPGVFDRAATNAIRRWRYAPMSSTAPQCRSR